MHAQQIFAVLVAAGAALTEARSIESRQLGNLQCNIARLQIVSALATTKNNVGSIQDATVQAAAAAGVKQAQDGISTIAKALVSGSKAPPEARDQVAQGLNATAAALSGGDQADQAVTDATTNLAKAATAGDKVVSECK